METKAGYAVVGAFVMILVLGVVATLLWLAGVQYAQEYEYFQTYFSGPVTGLGKGTIVRYNGIEVGRVDNLKFDPNDPKRVIVTLQTQPNLNIREDSIASIESEGLTGGSYVEIEGGTKDSPQLKAKEGERFPVIKSRPSTLKQLEESAPQLVAKLNVAADRLNDVLKDDNRKALSEILDNLDQTTSMLAKRSPELDTTFRNVAKMSNELDPTIKDVRTSVKKFGKLADDTDTLMTNSGLAQMGDLISDLRRLTASLTKLSDELDRNPTKLLFGDRRKGYTPK